MFCQYLISIVLVAGHFGLLVHLLWDVATKCFSAGTYMVAEDLYCAAYPAASTLFY